MNTDLPSLRIRIMNFVQALAGHVANGMQTVSTQEAERRLSVCETNECGHFTGTHCSHCGCPVNNEDIFINKIAWDSSKCPVEKW